MHHYPSVDLLFVLLGAVASFVWGGTYWGLLSPRIARAVGLDADTRAMPKAALAVGFLTRIVQAYAIAVVLESAGVGNPGLAALGGALLCLGFLGPIFVGQAMFGPPWGSWPRLAVALPEATVSFAIMGALGVLG